MTANQSGWKNHVNDPLLKQPQFLICIQICNFSGIGIPCNFSVSNNLQFATKLRPCNGKLLRKMKDNCLFCTCGFCFNEVKKYYARALGPSEDLRKKGWGTIRDPTRDGCINEFIKWK